MAWFKREKKPIENPTPVEERRVRTEGCGPSATPAARSSGKRISRRTGKSARSATITSASERAARLEMLLDDEVYTEYDADLASNDPLHFTDTQVPTRSV